MISELVAAYLRENKRLVIPGLGAFIRKDGSGEVVFVEFLKKDDGVLAGLLESQYGLSRTEAVEAMAQYVERVKQHIARNGRFVVGGVGVLHADSNSLLELAYDPAVSDREPEASVSAPVAERAGVEPQGNVPKPGVSGGVRPVVAAREGSKPDLPRSEEPVKVRPAVDPKPEQRKPVETDLGAVRRKAEEKRPSVVPTPAGATKPSERPMQGRSQGAGVPSGVRPVPRNRKKRADLIMIIAILAALLAIGVMVYSMFAQMNTGGNLLEVTPAVQDTVSVEK